MIEHTFDAANALLYVRPKSSLEKGDFEELAKTVDPFIAGKGDLSGIIVEAPGFPGWSSFGAMAAHLRFVKDHHKHIRKIALVTDSAIGDVAEHLVAHFIAAEIKHFPASESAAARQWVLNAL